MHAAARDLCWRLRCAAEAGCQGVLQDDANGDGGDEGGLNRPFAKRCPAEARDAEAQQSARRYRQARRSRSAKAKRTACHGHIGSGDGDITMGEVDGPSRPKRQREAKCQQAISSAKRQAVEQQL